MNRALTATLIFATVFLLGCPRGGKPVKPEVMSRVVQYEINVFEADLTAYNVAMNSAPPQLETARRLRDRTVQRLKRNVDANYHDFENQLFTRRAGSNILFDTIELGTAATTNIANGERVKSILAVGLTAFKGGRKSIDENIFRERTTEVLITKMRASRSRIDTRLTTKLTDLPVNNYSLDEALGDLIEYFYAGTLQSGLQELAQDAGNDADNAEKEANAAEDSRLATEARLASEADFDNSKQIRQKIEALFTDLRSDDEQRATNARTEIREILTRVGTTLPDNATDTDLRNALINESRKARREPERIPSLMQALKIQ